MISNKRNTNQRVNNIAYTVNCGGIGHDRICAICVGGRICGIYDMELVKDFDWYCIWYFRGINDRYSVVVII